MTAPPCQENELLIQAEIDGELDVAAAATLSAHVAGCAGCASLRTRLLGLRRQLRSDITAERAPDALRLFLQAQLKPRPRLWKRPRVAFATGMAIAASLVLMLPRATPDPLTDQAVAMHIRALQPGHLLDVVTSNQHVVKPWFDGRIDFAPPVKELSQTGFLLQGGRLDYVAHRPAAVLVYGKDRHVIDLFIMKGPAAASTGGQDGYNTLGWTDGDLNFLAVSDITSADLAAFATAWRATAG